MISPRQVSPLSKAPSTVENDFTSTTTSLQILKNLQEAIQIPSTPKNDEPKKDEAKKLGPKRAFLKKFIIGCAIAFAVKAFITFVSLSTFYLGRSKFLIKNRGAQALRALDPSQKVCRGGTR